MRALSLTQPWASLVAWDEKRYETRGWPTRERGWIAIVASKGFPADCRALCATEPFSWVLRRHGNPWVTAKASGSTDLPLCAVVALVELVDVIGTNPEGAARRLSRSPVVRPAEHEAAFGNYAPGRFAFITRGVRPLAHPLAVERVHGNIVKAGGALGFYTLSPACEAAVLAAIAGPGAVDRGEIG
jgi:hypothetical protein